MTVRERWPVHATSMHAYLLHYIVKLKFKVKLKVERRGLLAGRKQQPERMEPFVFGQSATPGASSGGGGAAGELGSKKTYVATQAASGRGGRSG